MRLCVVATLLVGCITPQPPGEPDLAVARRAPEPTPAPPTPPPLPPNAEVELGGDVTRPAGAKGELHTWVSDGPCWQASTRAYVESRSSTMGDRFFTEVFVPQGSQLYVCVALVDGKKPLTIYGQLERPLIGKGTGEVAFMGLKISLQKGKRVSAPPPLPPPAPHH
jgi:hypothetical protein